MINNTESGTDRHSWLEHIRELRRCLLRSALFFVCILCCILPFSSEVYDFFARPLMGLSDHKSLIATRVLSPFSVPLRLSCLVAFVLSLPYILFQLWSFIAPGLYKHEKFHIVSLAVLSFVLFLVGISFAYFVVLPLFFGFLHHVTPVGVAMMTDIEHYWSFSLGMFLAFGLAFQVPVLIFIFFLIKWVSLDHLKSGRRYFIVGSFIVSAILTPPDIVSQVLLAIPLCFLFEAGLLLCWWVERSQNHLKQHPS
jgi:sec-independent protein translocase protein TatC